MLKKLIGLSVAVLLVSGQAVADEATLKGLQTAGVELSDAQTQAVAKAEGDALVGVIAGLAKADPSAASTIVSVAVCSAPGQASAITPAAISAVPDQAEAINAAVALGCTPAGGSNAIGSGLSVPTNSIPTGGGTGGGVASPN